MSQQVLRISFVTIFHVLKAWMMTFFLVTFHKHYLFGKENDSIPFMLRGSDIQKKNETKDFWNVIFSLRIIFQH